MLEQLIGSANDPDGPGLHLTAPAIVQLRTIGVVYREK